MKNILLVIILAFLALHLKAQPGLTSENKRAQSLFEQANAAISSSRYDEAMSKLKEATKIDHRFIAAFQQLGDISRKLQNYSEARAYYEKVISLNPDFHQITYFGLAESEINTGLYQEALLHLTKYLSFPKLAESSKKQAQKVIEDCKFAIDAIKHPVPFNPVNLGEEINSADKEYLPAITADEQTLIFTKRINNNEDFFKSIKKNGKWEPAIYLSSVINTPAFNEGAQCISPDGMYLFFTGCNRPDGKGRCDIYVCRREGKDWSAPFNLGPPINTGSWESQPSLSADGRTLYFASNRPGGLGGYDIWKTEVLSGGEWTDPVNLGPTINTPYDEAYPFIHPDNQTFYFSSNGWPGLGNKDLFVSRKDLNGNWRKPQNLGYPINTHAEENSLTISTDGKTAYFASDVKGGFGGLDLYSFELPLNLRPAPVTYVKGTVFDSKTKVLLDAKVRITELKSLQNIYDDLSNEDGEFLATMPAGKSYGLIVEKEGYLFYSENFGLDQPNTFSRPFNIEVALQAIEQGSYITLNNIFFASNRSDLLPESKAELQELTNFLTSNPRVSIEISGHTDNVGEDKANQLLSENRAKAVYTYLRTNGITPTRLSFKGYGESSPVANNATEEGRQKNRRTEFRIVKY